MIVEGNLRELGRVQIISGYYSTILVDTVKFMKQHGCKSPLEIYCLFNVINDFYTRSDDVAFLLEHKSMDYSFEVQTMETRGLVTVLDGGVCRHRAAMLNDIYRCMDFDSVTLSGYSINLLRFIYGKKSRRKGLTDLIYTDGVMKKLYNGAKIEDFKKSLNSRGISYKMPDVHDEYWFCNRKMFNHACVMVGGDNRYYLDPMKRTTYYKGEGDEVTLRNRNGLYFFSELGGNKFYWGVPLGKNLDYVDTYNRIMQLPGADEDDTNIRIKEINTRLEEYKEEARDFASKNQQLVEDIKDMCYCLVKD